MSPQGVSTLSVSVSLLSLSVWCLQVVPAHMEVTEMYQVSCSIAFHHFLLRQALELTNFFWVMLAIHQIPEALLLPPLAALALWATKAILCSYLVAGDLNSGSRA